MGNECVVKTETAIPTYVFSASHVQLCFVFLITYLLFSDYQLHIHHSIHCHAFMLQYISPLPLLDITSTFCYNHMVNTKQFEGYNASL